MRPRRAVLALGAVGWALAACGVPPVPEREESLAVIWRAGPPLPLPVTSNAVAAVETPAGVSVFSFLGMDSTRTPGGVTNAAFRWDVGTGEGWRALEPVPGPGRVGASAQAVRGKLVVFGGSALGPDGSERPVARVDVYDPATGSWSRGADMPLAVDGAASGVWRDSLVLVVGGRHNGVPVADVQWYDAAADRWMRGDPLPGEPVYGHAGAVVGDHVVYLDGARRQDGAPPFVLDTAAWLGAVSPGVPPLLEWAPLPEHPMPGLFGAAGGAVGALAAFVGGAEQAHGHGAADFGGAPVSPVRQVLVYAPGAGSWRHLAAPPLASMDHRNLAVAGGVLALVGGTDDQGRVSRTVWVSDVEALLASLW